jgi:hypothetical protein
VLALDFDAIYVDLKATGGSAERAERAVNSAIEAIKEHGREDDAFILSYMATPAIVEMIRENGIRAGLKGYPGSPEETGEMVDKAAEAGFETICVNLTHLTPDLIEKSARQGIWHLAWHLGGEDDLNDFRSGAQAGIGGLITRHVDLVDREVAPAWRDVRIGLSQQATGTAE